MANFDQIIGNRARSNHNQGPFLKCSMCEQELDPMDFFVVAKAFNKGELAMEAVQCFSCQIDAKEYASEQSMENVMLYSGRRFNEFLQNSVQRKLYHLNEPSCLITGEELAPTDSFELYHFNVPGSGLADDNFVFIGPTAMEQLSDLLSEETRKSWGRFTESLTPEAPDIVVSPMFLG